MSSITVVGLDADDTLWHSENRFHAAHEQYRALLRPWSDVDDAALDSRMLEVERANLRLFGYGAKGFTLSLIETAIEVTEGRIDAASISDLLELGKELLDHPVELLPGVSETIDRLAKADLRLLLITKGDLWHQESKIAASGLADRFEAVEIVSEKSPDTYAALLRIHGVQAGEFCMVGNSVRSDILPAVEIGARGIHVPYEYLWAHEVVDGNEAEAVAFETVQSIREVPDLLGG